MTDENGYRTLKNMYLTPKSMTKAHTLILYLHEGSKSDHWPIYAYAPKHRRGNDDLKVLEEFEGRWRSMMDDDAVDEEESED